MRKTWLRGIGLVGVLAVVAAGCSSGRSTTSGTTTTKPPAAATFGDLQSPCGKGDAKGATDQGVTDTAITIAFGDDRGFQGSPGLNHEIGDAVKAMIKWCNDQGGINGRQVDGRFFDAKITDVNTAMQNACQQAFMLVGEGWALDSGQEEARVGCKLPAVPTYSVSPEFAHGPLMFQPVPNPVDFTPVEIASYLAKTFPDKIKKTAVMFANYAATIDTKDKALASYPPFGFQFLNCPQQYNILGESDWKPFAQKLKDCGAQIVYFTGSPVPHFENFLDAAAQLNYKPLYVTDANFYDLGFASWNKNGNGDNVYVREAYVPLDEANINKAVKDYLDIVKGQGYDVNQLGEQAASAFLLWATEAKACGSTLTRACMLQHLAQVTKWTGGGMHAETNPAKNLPPDCGLVLKLQGTAFVRTFPTQPGTYDCSPDYVKLVTGPVVDRAKLGPDRVATKFLK